MTSKELLYIEDALGHEQFMETKCQETASKIQDAELKTLVTQLEAKHKELFGKLYSLL
ncbi:hypothetical protein PMY56_15215 [Clostridium tertium]|jgi:hypothetical protein|uniref:Spore coat protein n=1 Tax=Clostridium tertium TaxID=1559 RepID=A0A9X3XRC3_9CLOT|nr:MULTISPECIES: hypothetical protein [Clostridium]EEH98442.1 hypothetical protein CSBG_02068 [Clostridium sp. 7_2_43FAA]MBS5307453.1 hypothetical protein [Clostridium sp.]MBU6137155.1 hypothetical protein [Clostridium tertium]MDB1924277.1 hypothetical protein [Clostridium tertium]MDB1927484.1 hypothetical protein [Clostridium tertium]